METLGLCGVLVIGGVLFFAIIFVIMALANTDETDD